MSLRRTWARVVGWRDRRRRSADLEAEIAEHLQILEAEFRASGMNDADARAAARRAFGNVTLACERTEEAWLFVWVESLVQDVGYGVRLIRRFPLFSALVISMLAIGLAASAALYSLIDTCIIHSVPNPVADRWIVVRAQLQNERTYRNFFSVPELDDVARLTDVFESTGSAAGCNPVMTAADPPERIEGACATASALAMTHVTPILGRLYTEDEDKPGAPPVVLLGYPFWQSHFHGDPSVVGRTIQLDRVDYTIVGVMPRYYIMWSGNLWMPFRLNHAHASRTDRRLWVTALTRPGVTDAAVNARLQVLSRLWAEKYGAEDPQYAHEVLATWNIQEADVAGIRPAYDVLAVAVGLLLLLTCANVASLTLARAMVRTRELTIRASIGAGRLRLVRQMIVEGLLLSTIAAAAGLVLAGWLLPVLVHLIPDQWLTVPPDRIRINGGALAMTASLAAICGLLFGIIPALRATSGDLASGIRERGTSQAGGRRDRRIQDALIGAEIALALAIASAAALTIMSYQRLTGIDPGFDADHVISSGGASLGGPRYARDADVERFYDLVFAHLRSEPDIVGAAAISGAPMAYRTVDVMSYDLAIEGRPQEAGRPAPNASFRIVSDDYFTVAGTTLLAGRAFGPRDRAGAQRVAIVNESMAKMFWPDGALGRRFTLAARIGRRDADAINTVDGGPITIVGVVADAVQVNVLTAPIRQEFYLPLRQRLADARGLTLVVRGRGDPASTVAALRRTMRAVDPQQAIFDVMLLRDRIRDALGPSRLTMLLLIVFGTIGLALSAVGVYALVSYTVAQRTREIGLRVAVGARPIDILRLIVGQSLWLAASGVLSGIAISLLTARIVATVLYGTSATDWRVLGGVSVLLTCVVIAAALAPARRATRVDPVSTLSGS